MTPLEPTGDWRGHPRWTCPHCAYDTLDETRMAEHLAQRHPAPRRARPLVNENEAARPPAPPPRPPAPPLVNENEAARMTAAPPTDPAPASPAATTEEDTEDGPSESHGRRRRRERE